MTTTVVEITHDRFDDIMAQFGDEAHNIVMETLFHIEAGAKRDAPVDKGLLRNSYQTVETGQGEGAVYTVVEYAPHQEFGTYRMAARPHLGPNAERQRGPFMERMSNIERKLR